MKSLIKTLKERFAKPKSKDFEHWLLFRDALFSNKELDQINNHWWSMRDVLLENNRLVGLELEDAENIVKMAGFQPHVITLKKGPGYDLYSGVGRHNIALWIYEGETIVISAA